MIDAHWKECRSACPGIPQLRVGTLGSSPSVTQDVVLLNQCAQWPPPTAPCSSSALGGFPRARESSLPPGLGAAPEDQSSTRACQNPGVREAPKAWQALLQQLEPSQAPGGICMAGFLTWNVHSTKGKKCSESPEYTSGLQCETRPPKNLKLYSVTFKRESLSITRESNIKMTISVH